MCFIYYRSIQKQFFLFNSLIRILDYIKALFDDMEVVGNDAWGPSKQILLKDGIKICTKTYVSLKFDFF